MPGGGRWLTWVMVSGTAPTSTATLPDPQWSGTTTVSIVLVSDPWAHWNNPPLAQREEETQHAARLSRYREACQRARQTLLSLLDAENRENYESRGEINVTGSAGGRYRICEGYSGNILDERGYRYCAHPPIHSAEGDRMPNADVMIAQMLMLATDEAGFLEIANRS